MAWKLPSLVCYLPLLLCAAHNAHYSREGAGRHAHLLTRFSASFARRPLEQLHHSTGKSKIRWEGEKHWAEVMAEWAGYSWPPVWLARRPVAMEAAKISQFCAERQSKQPEVQEWVSCPVGLRTGLNWQAHFTYLQAIVYLYLMWGAETISDGFIRCFYPIRWWFTLDVWLWVWSKKTFEGVSGILQRSVGWHILPLRRTHCIYPNVGDTSEGKGAGISLVWNFD